MIRIFSSLSSSQPRKVLFTRFCTLALLFPPVYTSVYKRPQSGYRRLVVYMYIYTHRYYIDPGTRATTSRRDFARILFPVSYPENIDANEENSFHHPRTPFHSLPYSPSHGYIHHSYAHSV